MEPVILIAYGLALFGFSGLRATPMLTQADLQVDSSLSVKDAEKLVAAWVAKNVKGQEHWHKKPPLKDITTKEIRQRLHAQVFQLADSTGSIDEADAYLIRGGQIYPFSIGFGGNGLTSMCVCDLDGNGKPELAYTYSWGSGVHRSHLELMSFDGNKPIKYRAGFVVRDVDLDLRESDDRLVKVYIRRGGTGPDVLLGALSLTTKTKGQKLDVVLDKQLPKKWANLIWRTGQ